MPRECSEASSDRNLRGSIAHMTNIASVQTTTSRADRG